MDETVETTEKANWPDWLRRMRERAERLHDDGLTDELIDEISAYTRAARARS